MRDQGWFDKEGVKVLEGKWQDFVDSEELLGIGGFDVVYTDTFSEDYGGTLHATASLHWGDFSAQPVSRATPILWTPT